MSKGIAVAGALVYDQHYTIPTYPAESLLVKATDPSNSIGGTGNLIFDLAKLDPALKIQVSSIIGSGSHGKEIERQLALYPNIDTSPLTADGLTSITYVMNAVDSKQRTFFYFPGSSDNYADEDILWDKIDDSAIFHLDYLFLLGKADKEDEEYGTGCARILHHAQELGMKSSFDMVSEKGEHCIRGCRAAARYSDYCSINEVELENGTGITVVRPDGSIDEGAVKAGLAQLKDWGLRTWAVCHSALCSYALDCATGIYYKHPSLNITKDMIVGKTGAGDAFCAGILYSAYRGDDLPTALALASGTSGISLFSKDGTSGMRNYDEVMKVYDKYLGGGCETF